jgi:trehalose-phosphatase
MQVLDRTTDIQKFFRHVSGARQRVLIFDYDGTLAPFHYRPHMAYPYPDITQVLDRLMRDDSNRVVIVSGRPVDQIMPLLRLARQPEIWGSHGWERLGTDGSLCVRHVDPDSRHLLEQAAALACGATEFGARIERKRSCVAMHWRGLPAIKAMKAKAWVEAAWSPLIHESGLDLQPFRGGMEVMARGSHKQYAVQKVLEETAPVLVGERLHDTHANLWIRPPHELRRFLGHWTTDERL